MEEATLEPAPARPSIPAALVLGALLLMVDFTTKAFANTLLPLERVVAKVLLD